jgi:hypothetical protein
LIKARLIQPIDPGRAQIDALFKACRLPVGQLARAYVHAAGEKCC